MEVGRLSGKNDKRGTSGESGKSGNKVAQTFIFIRFPVPELRKP